MGFLFFEPMMYYSIIERIIPFENSLSQTLLSDFNQSTKDPYHESICGSILLPLPTNSSSEIFSYLRHGKFDRFQRCLEMYHKEIIQMKNEHEQVNTFQLFFLYLFFYFLECITYFNYTCISLSMGTFITNAGM
jgi:hypothetical protein